MLETISRLGNRGASIIQRIGSSGLFLFFMLFRRPDVPRLWPLLRHQLYFIGVLSCLIIVVSALFIGMVVGLQGYNTLQKFGAASQ
jgi:phospholipid/cholesterol/gamma-HCH transport system permease protein